MKKIKNVYEVTEQDFGCYIRLGGRGILDGLKGEPVKEDLYKIIGINDEGLVAKGYRRQKRSILPFHSFEQEAEIYTPAEVKKLRKEAC